MKGVSVPPPFSIRPLPPSVMSLLLSRHAPPRLIAHLVLVYDVACELVEQIASFWPTLSFDAEAVRLGAATHDVGKLIHPDELSRAGSQHEAAGEQLLLAQGFPPAQARFARTHSRSYDGPELQLEDWLVALADAIWKGERPREIEDRILQEVATQTRQERWQVYSLLDAIIGAIAEGADKRLRWQTANGI